MEEDREFWFWKGQMFAAGPADQRLIATTMKINTIHACVERFRGTLQAIFRGYDGMNDLRENQRHLQFWVRMLGYWALGAIDHHRNAGTLNTNQPWDSTNVPDDADMVPLLSVKWAKDEKCPQPLGRGFE